MSAPFVSDTANAVHSESAVTQPDPLEQIVLRLFTLMPANSSVDCKACGLTIFIDVVSTWPRAPITRSSATVELTLLTDC